MLARAALRAYFCRGRSDGPQGIKAKVSATRKISRNSAAPSEPSRAEHREVSSSPLRLHALFLAILIPHIPLAFSRARFRQGTGKRSCQTRSNPRLLAAEREKTRDETDNQPRASRDPPRAPIPSCASSPARRPRRRRLPAASRHGSTDRIAVQEEGGSSPVAVDPRGAWIRRATASTSATGAPTRPHMQMQSASEKQRRAGDLCCCDPNRAHQLDG